MPRILLIDDDRDFSDYLRGELQQLGHEVSWCEQAEDGLRLLTSGEEFRLVLLDNRMPRMSGLEFLGVLKKSGLKVFVILITSAHNAQTAIQATKEGAFAYVLKPDSFGDIMSELGPEIAKALQLTTPPKHVPLPTDANGDDSEIIGNSKRMRTVLGQIGRLARVDYPVLILGETGTGKELVAKAVHTNSCRKDGPLVLINCTALNDNTLESELFGHEIGAWTGAIKLRKGLFEQANGGTLFLDEVGDMPALLQAKLLRVLQDGTLNRMGSSETIKVNVRVLAATHRDLGVLMHEGKFRQDLFFRLEGDAVHLPPLRERQEDVELLARHFLNRCFGSSAAPRLHPAALEALRGHSWPGNIRQLQKVLRRAANLARGSQILPEDLDFGDSEPGRSVTPAPPAAESPPSRPPDRSPAATVAEPLDRESALAGLRRAVAWAWQSEQVDLSKLLQQELERELLRFAVGQKLSEVKLAVRLGISRNTLRDRLEQYGLKKTPDTSV